jgi:hypothetical protein
MNDIAIINSQEPVHARAPGVQGQLPVSRQFGLEALHDIAEDVADCRTEQSENNNHDDCN